MANQLKMLSISLDQVVNYFEIEKRNKSQFELDDFNFSETLEDANSGHAEAQFKIAICYHEGIYIKKSLKKAFFYYKKAADRGHSFAQFNVGYLFRHGEGVIQSHSEALKYFKLSLDREKETLRNNAAAYAYAYIAECYLYGSGTERSLKDAIHYYNLGASLRDTSSINKLLEISEGLYGEYHEEDSLLEPIKNYLDQLIEIYTRKAEQGDSFSQYELGKLYESGRLGSISVDKAVYFYILAADQGYELAELRLAECYNDGKGVEQSTEKALEYYKRAADQGHFPIYYAKYLKQLGRFEESHDYFKFIINSGDLYSTRERAEAYIELGHNYKAGNGAEKSDTLALECYQQAYEIDPLNSVRDLARHLDYTQAYNIYKATLDRYIKRISEKDDDICYFIGNCFFNGTGVDKSVEEALKYYKIAEEKGGLCLSMLSFIYRNHMVEDPTYEKTFHYNQLMACQGNMNARYHLGKMYKNGLGAPCSLEKAIYYYQLSADQGEDRSLLELGLLHESGIGLEHSYEKAFSFYKKAADQGNSEAYYKLGAYYEQGLGVEHSQDQAIHYYSLAAMQKFVPAFYKYGLYLKTGQGVQQSYEKANQYFRLALRETKPLLRALAYLELGNSYEYGLGCAIDWNQAFKCYRHAYEDDNKHTFHIARAYEKGLGVRKSISKAMDYYQIGIDHGDINSQIGLIRCLARCHMAGFGQFEKSEELGAHYYKTAAELGGEQEALQYALCLKCGKGVPQSYEEAIKFLQHVIDAPNSSKEIQSQAYIELGKIFEIKEDFDSKEKAFNCYKQAFEISPENIIALERAYQNGIGLSESCKVPDEVYKYAFDYFLDEYKKGDAGACFWLAQFYEGNRGVDRDETNILYYTDIGASRGECRCLLMLGVFFENETFVERSYEKAVMRYQEASKNGYGDASARLAMIYFNGVDGIEQDLGRAQAYKDRAYAQGIYNKQMELELEKISVNDRLEPSKSSKIEVVTSESVEREGKSYKQLKLPKNH